MPARKAPPPIVQRMMVGLGAYLNRDQSMLGCILQGLAPRNQIRSGAAHGVFHHVGKKGRQDQANEEAEDGDVNLVKARPKKRGPKRQHKKWKKAGVCDIPRWVWAEIRKPPLNPLDR